jgi:FixJ family two-component response regulator
MSGRELAERLCAAEPGIRVLFMSGYTDDAVIRRGLLEPTMAFLGKPFTVEELARVVRRTLDAETVVSGSATAIEAPESVPGSSSLPARRDPRSTKK